MAVTTKKGMNVMLMINGTAVAYQRGATLNQSADTIDTTNKQTGGYKTYESSFKEWSIDCDGVLPEGDTAFESLRTAFANGEIIEALLVDETGKGVKGNVIITDFPIEYPYDAEATYNLTLQGTGALTNVTGTGV